MNLIVNIGNTNTKLALFQNNELKEQAVFNNNSLNDILSFLREHTYSQAILSNTSFVEQAILQEILQQTNYIEINAQTKLPFQVEYDSRESIGDDRLAAVAGAQLQNDKDHDLLIITAGSCITYNTLTADNVFLGGGISPGIHMRYKAMNTFTDQLPLVQNKNFDELVGRSTEQSLQSGVRKGIVAEMDGIISQYKLLYPKIQVFICGGDASFFESRLKNKIFAHSNLELIGMNEILKYNQTD